MKNCLKRWKKLALKYLVDYFLIEIFSIPFMASVKRFEGVAGGKSDFYSKAYQIVWSDNCTKLQILLECLLFRKRNWFLGVNLYKVFN